MFYLDTLPNKDDLKTAINVFRGGDSLFNFLNSKWRTAKKMLNSMLKKKSKFTAGQCLEHTTLLLQWIEHRARYVSNAEYREKLGPLFKGLDSSYDKAKTLHAWYRNSLTELINYPSLMNQVNLTQFDSRKIHQLNAVSARIADLVGVVEDSDKIIVETLGDSAQGLRDALREDGWGKYVQRVYEIANKLEGYHNALAKLVRPSVSPSRAAELVGAKRDFQEATQQFAALINGIDKLREAGGDDLPGLTSIECKEWSEYLGTISRLGNDIEGLCDYLKGFTSQDTPNTFLNFARAKLLLDDALTSLAIVSSASMVKSWKEYTEEAAAVVKSSLNLSSLLIPVAQPGKSTREILEGLEYKAKADSIQSSLSADVRVEVLLRDHFKEIETDIDGISASHKWGETIAVQVGKVSEDLTGQLLCADVLKKLHQARGLVSGAVELYSSFQSEIDKLKNFGTFNWNVWNESRLPDSGGHFTERIVERLEYAAADIEAVLPWSKYLSQKLTCEKAGLGDFVKLMEQGRLPASSVGDVFHYVTFRSIGRSIYSQFPELANFSGHAHSKIRDDFIRLDKEIIGATGKMLAHKIDSKKSVPYGNTGARAAERTEMQLLLHELGKQRRHLPIRQLIRRAGLAIQALKPCFMMGPLSVAQYIEQGAVDFDIVVMDEASQLRPEEALGAVVRGKQLVIVGDPKQLPPTNFFERMVDSEEEEDMDNTPAFVSGSESILDICQQLFHPVRTLRWHYRSQHQSLIAFSNHHFYNDKLVVFPSPYHINSLLGLRYRYLKNGVYHNRQNVPEAQRVVDAIIEHMIKQKDASLGVVTLNQTQRDLIEDILDAKLRNLREAQDFISYWERQGWPFFIKNLENVQGDERDVIFISTTFGRANGTEKIRQNFGPISRPNGWRRLNVLFTRARRKIDLFTSLLPEDLIIDSTTPAGTKALHDYLDFAKRGVLTTTDYSEREADSDFEIAVSDLLRQNGYEIVPQLGVKGFFIDIAVRNPDKPGEFLAAVECDGASYHSSRSARDRDRIRQEILESLGWKGRIWRIWSTDWFYNHQREVNQLFAFLQKRREESQNEPTSTYEDFGFDKEVEEKESSESTYESIVEEKVIINASGLDVFVEVGDRVAYCFVDDPNVRNTIFIVDSPSNPKLKMLNEHTPIAQALLGLSVGEDSVLELPNGKSRSVRVVKIERL